MLGPGPITFVVASNDEQVLANNLLLSPCFNGNHPHQILIQRGFVSASKAFNDALDKSINNLVVFAHQDIIFPQSWMQSLVDAFHFLESADPNWGVLGCYGETLNDGGRGFIYEADRGFVGRPLSQPEPVQTLDEIVLILRRSSGLRFNPRLRHFHLYGADICMVAAQRGMRSYAIPASCVHNAQLSPVLPWEFYACCRDLKRLWYDHLPIQTTCMRISKNNFFFHRRRLHDTYLRYVRRVKRKVTRLDDVGPFLQALEAEVSRLKSSRTASEEARLDVA